MNPPQIKKASIIEYMQAFERYIPEKTSPKTMEILGKSISCAFTLISGLAARRLAPYSLFRSHPRAAQASAFICGCCIAEKTQNVISHLMSSYVVKKKYQSSRERSSSTNPTKYTSNPHHTIDSV
jgi:hypothetical protein